MLLISACGNAVDNVDTGDDFAYREDRDFTSNPVPSNELNLQELPPAGENTMFSVGTNPAMRSGDYRLEFVHTDDEYYVRLVHLAALARYDAPAVTASVMYENKNPVKLYIRSSAGTQYNQTYSEVVTQEFGYLAAALVTTPDGSEILIEDRYYFPPENETGVFNVRRLVKVLTAGLNDRGFESIYDIAGTEGGDCQWFVPNNIFDDYPDTTLYKVYRETLLGLPFAMMRNKTNGYTVSLGRYQPIITHENNSYAGISVFRGGSEAAPKIEITYPSRDTSRKYFDIAAANQIVYDLSLRAEATADFAAAMSSVYNAHYRLHNPRIVNTDIDTVYQIINEDFKDFMLSNTKNGITSYGLPWRITIETGKLGPMSYQSGFVGQQIPAAYNMMLYGIMNNDFVSLKNGVNILDFWLEAGMMNPSGVPRIWYFGDSNRWHYYPTFLRMAVDTMEGYLDAYRLAIAHNIGRSSWFDAISNYADFLVAAQNSDGSWYRCYSWSGEMFKDGADGIREPGGNICQSESKKNTTMPVRFLGKMYELTGKEEYKTAVLAAGEYIYNHLYPENKYYGGTCDNPNAIDKEAGVYAMYAYDALYMLTEDDKWIDCLRQATAFTMSTVMAIRFPIKANASDLKAAYPLKYGYTDGLSFITCGTAGIDNYIAYIYYQLFRIYIITGDETYLKQAEFIQQNTKSTMDWDGALGFPYRSLVAEASTIYSFGFGSAVDDEGIMGVWLPWSSVANVEPIAKMIVEFGAADVMHFKDISLAELRDRLAAIGIGGNAHRTYPNTVVNKLK